MSTVVQRSIANEQQQIDAFVIQASGLPANALAVRSEPVPQPGPGEVLVEVHAAAVNPLDVANVQGFLGTPLPMIRGVDYAPTSQPDMSTGGATTPPSGLANRSTIPG